MQARSHRFSGAFPGLLNARMLALWFTLWLFICTDPCHAMRVYKAWTTKNWCNSVFAPHWPFAYKIDSSSSVASKGRTVSNYQHLGHVIDFRGALTKTWRCEEITCNSGASTCQMQIQGMDIGQCVLLVFCLQRLLQMQRLLDLLLTEVRRCTQTPHQYPHRFGRGICSRGFSPIRFW